MLEGLVAELRHAMTYARPGEKVLMLNLFGIQHADRLGEVNLRKLIEAAGMAGSFAAELRRGIRLAEHVQVTGSLLVAVGRKRGRSGAK